MCIPNCTNIRKLVQETSQVVFVSESDHPASAHVALLLCSGEFACSSFAIKLCSRHLIVKSGWDLITVRTETLAERRQWVSAI